MIKNWEKNKKKKEEMEKQAKKEEEKIAQEKEEWESWLEGVSEDTNKKAEEYAEKKIKEVPYNPSDYLKRDMLGVLKRTF